MQQVDLCCQKSLFNRCNSPLTADATVKEPAHRQGGSSVEKLDSFPMQVLALSTDYCSELLLLC